GAAQAPVRPTTHTEREGTGKMDTPPSRCIVVEDSVAGVKAAKSAGMTCVGFTGGAHCAEGHSQRLYDAGANIVVDELEAIKSLVE
ncbi:MAG: HAD family phosphatase, partial [Roseovarius sp.]